MNDYASYLKTNGFYLLDYFNFTEFGSDMASTSPERKPGVPLWENPRAFLEAQFPKALLIAGSDVTGHEAWVVDPGDPDYHGISPGTGGPGHPMDPRFSRHLH